MKNEQFSVLPTPMPEREELRGLPQAPRIIMDISRLLRYHVRSKETEAGVMQSHAARLLMAHLAVGGEMSQLALAEKTHFSTPTVSILLRKMEEQGYVLRVPDPKDRRVMLVSLTQKGIAFDREHLAHISENDRRATAGFTPEQEQMLVSLLLRMYENLKER